MRHEHKWRVINVHVDPVQGVRHRTVKVTVTWQCPRCKTRFSKAYQWEPPGQNMPTSRQAARKAGL